MKKFYLPMALAMALIFNACTEDQNALNPNGIPQSVIDQISNMGFNPDGIEEVEEGYRIERDIIITHALLAQTPNEKVVPGLEQYRTTNVVNTGGSRNITMYAEEGGRNGYSPGMIAGLNEAIARYNAEGLDITFSRTSNKSSADIVMTRLKKGEERRGILGSAGFPTASGDPYDEIKMSGILESHYGLSTEGIATIIAHEMGHCIGFRHTDYFNRSISCGSGGDEGQSSVGAHHIPGTPTGATLADKSFMLSCTDGGDRPFNGDDQTALSWMYSGNF